MTLLIINADDFGYSSGINYGIIDAFQQGVLSSTTIMANMPGFDHAVELSQANPDLGIGVHLTLTCGNPLCNDVPTLTNEQGAFRKLSFYENDFSIDEDELYREWKAQIEKVIENGIVPTHLDSHHHVNSIPKLTETFVKLAKEYNLPVRNNYRIGDENSLVTTEHFVNYFDKLAVEKDMWKHMSLKNLIDAFKNYDSIEIMCHPGYVDEELLDRSSFTNNRPYVGKELRDKIYPKLFKEFNVNLGTFKDLASNK